MMPTKEQIQGFASKHFSSETGWNGFVAGATWANNQNAAEIAELVAVLGELNGIVRSNFGIAHEEAAKLIKKHAK